jgi:hypothetical protein
MGYDSPATEKQAGFGRPIDDPDLQTMTAEGTAVFGEAVAMVADALGVELDDVVCRPSTPRPRRTSISAHGRSRRDAWRGRGELAGPGRGPDRGRAERPVEEGPTLEPDWQIEDGWVIEVQGRPDRARRSVQFLPPPDFEAKTLADFMVLGHIMTAMPRSTRLRRLWRPRRASSPIPICRCPCREDSSVAEVPRPRQSRAVAAFVGRLAGVFDVLGIVGRAHAEPPLAAHVAGSTRGGMARISTFMFGLYILVVTIIDFGQVEWQFFSRMSGRPIASHWIDGHAAVERHDADVGLGHLEGQVERLARHGGGVASGDPSSSRRRCCR